MTKLCKVCGEIFIPRSNRQVYCSNACRLANRREKYNARREAGKCTFCGKPAEGSLCLDCAAKNTQAVAIRRGKYAAEQRCRDCGQPVEPGHTRCGACLLEVNRSTQELRDERFASGLCTRCGRPPIHRNRMCKTCYEHALQRYNALRVERRLAELCIICGEPAVRNADRTISPYCTEHRRKVYAPQLRRYWERRRQGLCVDCGHPAFEKGDQPMPLLLSLL